MTKDFLSIFDITAHELEELFVLTDALKADPGRRPLYGKTAALIFQKPSLRTRVSFEVGIYQLGGHPVFLSQESIGLGRREPASDVAKLLSRYNDLIVTRLFEHSLLLDLAASATIPVINALTDLSHPCQVLADMYTLRQRGRLKKRMKVAFIGDGNNVANSWLEACALYPIHFVLAAPEGYEPNQQTLRQAQHAGVSTIEIVRDPAAASKDADLIYTDVWTSMGQEGEAEKRLRDFNGYQVNETLLALAKPDCLVMHCLPAHRGEEVSDQVLDSERSIIFDQAENRLHVQKAIMTKLIETHHKKNKSDGKAQALHRA
ncbi:MAG: ornithine carbamoyltransferase [Bacteroidota bacterium]